MTEHLSSHLSSTALNSLVDAELSAEQAAAVQEHLAHCPACTAAALNQSLLKTATARAGRSVGDRRVGDRHEMPSQLEQRLRRLASSQALDAPGSTLAEAWSPSRGVSRGMSAALAIAATLLVVAMTWFPLQRHLQKSDLASAQRAALVTQIADLHVATLASNQAPEVISSDRHTVKPWFQGKIPFSFNLPDNLPGDTKLDGANLTYLNNRPVAQLLYSIGRHRVSVFVQQKSAAPEQAPTQAEYSGFHITGFHTSDLDVVAVSDVDPARLAGLVHSIEQAQTPR
jgi:anti-sigma factor RsiW